MFNVCRQFLSKYSDNVLVLPKPVLVVVAAADVVGYPHLNHLQGSPCPPSNNFPSNIFLKDLLKIPKISFSFPLSCKLRGWNISSPGPTKLERAAGISHPMANAFAGFVHDKGLVNWLPWSEGWWLWPKSSHGCVTRLVR